MNFDSILGKKTQDEIDLLIEDEDSILHSYMRNCNTKADTWITVNDLISAIEQRIIENSDCNIKLVTREARFSKLNDLEVEICSIGDGFYDDEDGNQFILVPTEFMDDKEKLGNEMKTKSLLEQLNTKADKFGSWPIVSVTDQFTSPDGSVFSSYGTNNYPYLIWNAEIGDLWLLESPEDQWPEYNNA